MQCTLRDLILIRITGIDLIGWTRASFKIDFVSLTTTPHRVAAVLFMMQIPDMQTILLAQYIAGDAIPGLLCLMLIWTSPCRFYSAKEILRGILLTLAMVGIILLHVNFIPWSVADFVTIGCSIVIWWKRVEEYSAGKNPRSIAFRRFL
jgi:hypothetical protein